MKQRKQASLETYFTTKKAKLGTTEEIDLILSGDEEEVCLFVVSNVNNNETSSTEMMVFIFILFISSLFSLVITPNSRGEAFVIFFP